jgi:hypothetical protein
VSLNIGNPNPNIEGHRARLGKDCTIPHHSRRKDDLRSERSHPIANSPIDRASGSDANRVLGAACADTAARAAPLTKATITARIPASLRT